MQQQKPALAYGVKKAEYAKRVREYKQDNTAAAIVAADGIFAGLLKVFS